MSDHTIPPFGPNHSVGSCQGESPVRTVTLDLEVLVCDEDVEPPLLVAVEQVVVFIAQVAP